MWILIIIWAGGISYFLNACITDILILNDRSHDTQREIHILKKEIKLLKAHNNHEHKL